GTRAVSAAPGLIELLRHESAITRAVAAAALARIGAEAVPALLGALKDDEKQVRRLAARTLGHIRPATEATTRALAELVNDPDPAVGEGAAEALRQLSE